MKATHKEHSQIVGTQQILLKPGQFVFGRKKASEEIEMSEQSIRTCYAFLKKAGNLTIKSTNRFSIITICNWETYQHLDNGASTSRSTKSQPATNQQLTTNKNVKKEKNEKNKDKYGEFVFLLPEEYEKLVDRYQEDFTKACIEKLDNTIGSKGDSWKNHYRTILNWVVRAVKDTGEWEE